LVMVLVLLAESLVWGLVAGPELVPVVLVLVLETVILVTEISLQACRYHLRRGICDRGLCSKVDRGRLLRRIVATKRHKKLKSDG